MELPEYCLQLGGHIAALTHVHTALLHILTKTFLSPPFCEGCAGCKACCTHLFGAYEAQRWGGSYMYYCPRGLLFLAVLPRVPETVAEYCMVIGPVVMENHPGDSFDGPPEALEGIPRLTTAQVRSLCELSLSALSLPAGETHSPEPEAELPPQVLYDYAVNAPQATDYPIEQEQQLQEYIRSGNKASAERLLNELLARLYISAGSNMERIKPRIHELLVLMNRAAIDGGADIDEIFSLCCQYEHELDSFQRAEALDRWLSMILHRFIGFVFDFSTLRHQDLIFKTTDYIKQHLSERISLEQAAAQAYVSKSYFCRIMKSELGCTFTEYVNRLRIERSCRLLRTTRLSVSEISLAVGFEDQSYFTRIFKKQLGQSPGKYREQGG